MTPEARTPPQKYWAGLRQNLAEYFSAEELRTLCADLEVDYDNLPGENKEAKARELVNYLKRRERILELIATCSKQRPNVSWEAPPEPTSPPRGAEKPKKQPRKRVRRDTGKAPTPPSKFPHDESERLALQNLLDDVKQGKCILFLGMRALQGSGEAGGWSLANELARELRIQAGALSRVAETYQARFGRDKLVQRVRRLIRYRPTIGQVSSYDLLPEIEPLSRLIFSTELDDQLEQAFRRKGIPIIPAKYSEQAGFSWEHPHIIVKLRGDLGSPPDEIVLTRDDYTRAYQEVMKPDGWLMRLKEKLSASTLLFAGYDLKNEDFHLLYDHVQEFVKAKGRTHYAVMPDADVPLKEYWRERNVIILDATPYELLEHVAHQVRDFINREQEKAYVIGADAAPYTEFYGVAGSGKTELLKKITDHYRLRPSWEHASIDFEERPGLTPLDLASELSRQTLRLEMDQSKLIKRAKQELAQSSKPVTQQQVMSRAEHLAADDLGLAWATRRVALLFDTSEQIPAPIQSWIEGALAPAMEKHIGDLKAQARLVFAGRKPVSWRDYRFKQYLRLIPLSPFDETSVGEMLDWFAALKLREPFPRPKRQRIIRDTLDITGGYPACIKQVLQDIASQNFDVPAVYVSEHREQLFVEFVYPALNAGILKKVPEGLRPVLATASVFRRLLPDFLDVLIEKGYVGKGCDNGLTLLGRLRETYLVLSPRPPTQMYDIDVVVRRILALQMELQESKRYRELNTLALDIYTHRIQGQIPDGAPLPEAPGAELQVAYIVEAIFHQLIQASLDGLRPQDIKSNVRSKLGEYHKTLRSRIGMSDLPRVLEILAARLGDDPNQADRELLALVEKLVPGDGYQMLLEPVMVFLDQARGGSYHGH